MSRRQKTILSRSPNQNQNPIASPPMMGIAKPTQTKTRPTMRLTTRTRARDVIVTKRTIIRLTTALKTEIQNQNPAINLIPQAKVKPIAGANLATRVQTRKTAVAVSLKMVVEPKAVNRMTNHRKMAIKVPAQNKTVDRQNKANRAINRTRAPRGETNAAMMEYPTKAIQMDLPKAVATKGEPKVLRGAAATILRKPAAAELPTDRKHKARREPTKTIRTRRPPINPTKVEQKAPTQTEALTAIRGIPDRAKKVPVMVL